METGSAPFDLPLMLLRQEIAASKLLPKPYDHYLSLLADGLCFFLRRLSPSRLQGIFKEQLELQGTASTAQRIVAILGHLPALHKLGQVVARDRRLQAGFRRRLQQLESVAPQISVGHVRRLLRCDFKDWEKAEIRLGRRPLAEGSVAVVMPFVQRAHPDGQHHGVFKLLKPGISERLEEDLKILTRLGQFLDQDCERLHLPALDYQDTFNTVRDLLLHEVRLDEEQKTLAEARRLYGSGSKIHIPELFPFCSLRVTAMERLFGRKISSANSLPAGSRKSLAQTIVQALIAMPIFSPQPESLFHADPHAGNLLLMREGCLGVLDWSLTGRLKKGDRIELVQLVLGGPTHDVERMERAVARLSQQHPAQAAVRAVLHACLAELSWGTSPGFTWLTGLLDKLVLRAGVRFAPNQLLFRKSLLTLSGVVADLAGINPEEADALLDQTMMAAFLEHWIAEWPDRFQARVCDRHFATHLSNADLLGLLWSMPAAFARGWEKIGQEFLHSPRRLEPSGRDSG